MLLLGGACSHIGSHIWQIVIIFISMELDVNVRPASEVVVMLILCGFELLARIVNFSQMCFLFLQVV